MKNKLFTLIFLFTVALCFSQNEQTNFEKEQAYLDNLMKQVDLFVSQNIDLDLPIEERNRVIRNAKIEGIAENEIPTILEKSKKEYLKGLYFQDHASSELHQFPETENTSKMTGCLSEGFEGTVSGYGLKYGTTSVSCGANNLTTVGSINMDPSNIPYGTNATIVSYGNDPIVSQSGHYLNRVSTGSRALRINQNEYGWDNNEVDIVYKRFTVNSGLIRFDFATVLENFTEKHEGKMPYFKYTIYTRDGIVMSDCYEPEDPRLDNTSFIFTDHLNNDHPYVFSEWETVTLDLSDRIGETLYIAFEAGDCGISQHGGYVYIDNIENCPATCPTNYGLYLNAGEPLLACNDVNAGTQLTSNNDVAYIEWRYTISSTYQNVFIGNTQGNGNNQHAVNFSLPAPNPGHTSWNGFNLYVKARPHLIDSTVCNWKTISQTMICNSNGGGGDRLNTSQEFGEDKDIILYPNPTDASFKVEYEGESDISTISIRDIYGLVVQQRSTNLDGEFNLTGQREGFYLVEIQFTDGTTVIKKLILK